MRERHTLIAIALLSLITCTAAAQDRDGYDFRKTLWGMTPAQVKAIEKSELALEGQREIYDPILAYKGTAVGLPTFIYYLFVHDQLIQGRYWLVPNYSNKTFYLQDYTKIKEALISKYGRPIEDNLVWNNATYRDEPANYGLALSLGHFSTETKWKTPSTEIILILRSLNNKVEFFVTYRSIKLWPLVESEIQKQIENDL